MSSCQCLTVGNRFICPEPSQSFTCGKSPSNRLRIVLVVFSIVLFVLHNTIVPFKPVFLPYNGKSAPYFQRFYIRNVNVILSCTVCGNSLCKTALTGSVMKNLGSLKRFPPVQIFQKWTKIFGPTLKCVDPVVYVYILGFPGLIATWYVFHFHHQPQYMHGKSTVITNPLFL